MGQGRPAADAGDRLTAARPGEAAHYERDELWDDRHDASIEHQRQRFEATAALVPPGTTSILELGSGDGRVLRHLATVRPGVRLHALDRSRTALRTNPYAGPQASLDAVPFADRSVDVVLCCEVLEHLPEALLAPACAELARVAAHSVIVTVPNRENRERGAIDCAACGCRYNPDRHLRSFGPADLVGLVPGFRVAEVTEAGPRHPVYPRRARLLLEQRGLLTRPGSPTCPQCGHLYEASSAARAPGAGTGGEPGGLRSLAERALPKRRHPYWLCARFER